jgi:caffeoyl-CoA O-methyltransferase
MPEPKEPRHVPANRPVTSEPDLLGQRTTDNPRLECMTMELFAPQVTEYLNDLARHGDPVLERLEKQAAESRFPIVGPPAGRYCYLIARLINARRIFELGSGFGYSTIWFAKAVRENGGGEVYHTVWDEELSRQARANVEEAGLSEIVRFQMSEAVAALKQAEGQFDLIFNDIDKQGYPDSLPIIKQYLRPGGVLIIDNMLWHGRLWDENDRDPMTEGVRRVTQMIRDDPDFAFSLIPIRDGLITAMKLR